MDRHTIGMIIMAMAAAGDVDWTSVCGVWFRGAVCEGLRRLCWCDWGCFLFVMVLVVAVGLMIVTLRVGVGDVLLSLPADILLCLVGSARLRLVDCHLVSNVDSRCVKSACCAAGSGALSDMSGLMGDLQQSRLGSARQGLGCWSPFLEWDLVD